MAWAGQKVTEHDLAGRFTLEVGSFDVNGTVRRYFTGPYVGVDFRAGPGVDMVADANRLPFSADTFPCVVCTEMLEHDPAPWLSVPQMARVLRPGGILLLTARGIGFPLHDYPSDYWRFTPSAFVRLFDLAGLEPVEVIDDTDTFQPGVFGVARKAA